MATPLMWHKPSISFRVFLRLWCRSEDRRVADTTHSTLRGTHSTALRIPSERGIWDEIRRRQTHIQAIKNSGK